MNNYPPGFDQHTLDDPELEAEYGLHAEMAKILNLADKLPGDYVYECEYEDCPNSAVSRWIAVDEDGWTFYQYLCAKHRSKNPAFLECQL